MQQTIIFSGELEEQENCLSADLMVAKLKRDSWGVWELVQFVDS